MIYKGLKQFIRFSKNSSTYTAYPTKRKEISNNVDTINIDTVEKNLRLSDKKTLNSSVN
jgi:hypothetical protein